MDTVGKNCVTMFRDHMEYPPAENQKTYFFTLF